MHVRLVTDGAEFSALQPAWDRLHARCAPGDLFLSHAWFDAAWQWGQQQATLHLLVCEREDGELAGVLPLTMRQSAAARPARRELQFLHVPDTQRCDALAVPPEADVVFRAFARWLARRSSDWDIVRLDYLPGDCRTLRALVPALGGERVVAQARERAMNPWVALDSSWKQYYASRSRRLKKALNLAANRLAKAGRVEIQWLAPGTGEPADVERTLDTIIAISAKSWKTRTGNSLDNPGPQAFIRRIAQHAHALGWLSVWTLALDGAPVAMEFQLICNGAVHALRSDFDASVDELSPGSHLGHRLLEKLFDAGYSRYYMGPGENPYKYRWAQGSDAVHEVRAFARSWRGRSLAAWELALKPAARRLRGVFQRRDAVPLPEALASDK